MSAEQDVQSQALIECLLDGYRRIVAASDSEMMDGDLARDIARAALNGTLREWSRRDER